MTPFRMGVFVTLRRLPEPFVNKDGEVAQVDNFNSRSSQIIFVLPWGIARLALPGGSQVAKISQIDPAVGVKVGGVGGDHGCGFDRGVSAEEDPVKMGLEVVIGTGVDAAEEYPAGGSGDIGGHC